MQRSFDETLVGSQPSPSKSSTRGFTLLDVQIAIVILAVAMLGMVGHGRAYRSILDALQREHRFDGVAVAAKHRVIVSVAEVDSGGSPPRCEVEVDTVELDGTTATAELGVTRRTP
jgi:hypothetical protein